MENEKDPAAEEVIEAVPSETSNEPIEESFFKKNRKKLLVVGSSFVGLILLGIGSYFGYLSFKGEVKEDPLTHPQQYLYFHLPNIVVNLNQITARTTYLRMQAALQVANEGDIKALTVLKPRIVDQLQLYLREIKPSDFNGAAAVERLREELLIRIRKLAEPIQIQDLLFQELLFQ